jgi:hypothetical protein
VARQDVSKAPGRGSKALAVIVRKVRRAQGSTKAVAEIWAHNDLAGFTIAVIGVLYAVLLAFIAIATWESFSKASDIVEAESDYAGGIYLDTQGLPQAEGKEIRDAVAKLRQCRHRRGMADPAGRQGTRPGMEAAA